MKASPFKPFLWLGMFVLIVGLACNAGGAPAQTEAPPPAAPTNTQAPPPPEPTPEPAKPTDEPVVVEPESGAVDSLEDVEKAVILIEVEGTFIDPEVGWEVNVGARGSGFIIDPDGIAVTNNHVVTGAALIKVWVGGETKPRNAKVLGVSECSDLAVIDIDGGDYPYLEWYDGTIKTGLKVFSAGFPLGDPTYTLTDGIVSKSQTEVNSSWASVDIAVEHSARINPGNSGGPLVTENGKVIGVNYANIADYDQNFAIGRDEALDIIDNLREGKDIDTIGVNGGSVYGEVDGIPIYGVWVRSVASGSPADKALIEAGDIIYQLEGQVLATDGSMADYCDILRSRDTTDTMDVTVIRFSDLSLMEGQLNGRELAVTGYFTGDGSGGTGEPVGDDYVTITDDTGTIQMNIPASWAAVDGRPWESTWGNLSFLAPSITASTDWDDYDNYLAPGVFFAASDRLGEIGGFVELLDGVRSWYEDDGCTLDRSLYRVTYGTGDFYDPIYEGKFDVWKNCLGTDIRVMVLAARPKADPTAFLMLVEIRYITDADLDALYEILNTFEVVGSF